MWKQWPWVQAWDQHLPHGEETLHSAGRKWMHQYGSLNLLFPSLSFCVCSIHSCYDFTYNSLYVFVQWNKAVGQCCIVLCARVCESVSFTASAVLLFGLIVIRWDKDTAKYGKCPNRSMGKKFVFIFPAFVKQLYRVGVRFSRLCGSFVNKIKQNVGSRKSWEDEQKRKEKGADTKSDQGGWNWIKVKKKKGRKKEVINNSVEEM